MNKSTAAIVWLVGFAIAMYILTQCNVKDPGVWGFIVGVVWTGLIISSTKKDQHGRG